MHASAPSFSQPASPRHGTSAKLNEKSNYPVGASSRPGCEPNLPRKRSGSFSGRTPIFAQECVAALAKEGPPLRLPERDLAPAVPTRHPRLRSLDAETMAEMDSFAGRTLAAYLRCERTIWDYRWSNRFDPSFDTWATTADWVHSRRTARRRRLAQPRGRPLALVQTGRPEGYTNVRDLLQRMEPHHEVSDAAVELVWRFRHAPRPDIARKWFCDGRSIRCPSRQCRARLGDPVGAGPATCWPTRASTLTTKIHGVTVRIRPSPGLAPTLKSVLASATGSWNGRGRTGSGPPPSPTSCTKSLWLGLDEVASALTRMRILPTDCCAATAHTSCLTNRASCWSADFLLAWSRLKPTRLLAQIVATAHTGDMLSKPTALRWRAWNVIRPAVPISHQA